MVKDCQHNEGYGQSAGLIGKRGRISYCCSESGLGYGQLPLGYQESSRQFKFLLVLRPYSFEGDIVCFSEWIDARSHCLNDRKEGLEAVILGVESKVIASNYSRCWKKMMLEEKARYSVPDDGILHSVEETIHVRPSISNNEHAQLRSDICNQRISFGVEDRCLEEGDLDGCSTAILKLLLSLAVKSKPQAKPCMPSLPELSASVSELGSKISMLLEAANLEKQCSRDEPDTVRRKKNRKRRRRRKHRDRKSSKAALAIVERLRAMPDNSVPSGDCSIHRMPMFYSKCLPVPDAMIPNYLLISRLFLRAPITMAYHTNGPEQLVCSPSPPDLSRNAPISLRPPPGFEVFRPR